MNADERRCKAYSLRRARVSICVHLRSSAVPFIVLVLVAGRAHAKDSAEVSPIARTAIARGLRYLASTQREDGSWAGRYGNTTGIVGSCCLAFMAAGHAPGQGKYGVNVARGIRFIVRRQRPDGLLFRTGMQGQPMYHHGLATLALAEAWGMTQDVKIRGVLKRAVERIVTCQNRRGGWRYHPRPADDDLSVTVMQLMALRAARDAGVYVSKDVISAGIEYVKSCHNAKEENKDGGFSYQPRRDSGFARTGAGVLSLQVAGRYRAKEVKQGVEYLVKFRPTGRDEVKRFYFYGHYYAAQGIYQSQTIGTWGKRAWAAWYPAITRELTARQDRSGAWKGGYGEYSTAMAILVLAVPYRYLPIYQR